MPEKKKMTAEITGNGKFIAPTYSGPAATREAYGDALKALGAAYSDVVVVDAEVSNSTYAEKFAKAFLDRYFEMYIAEQLMVGVGLGLGTRGKKYLLLLLQLSFPALLTLSAWVLSLAVTSVFAAHTLAAPSVLMDHPKWLSKTSP